MSREASSPERASCPFSLQRSGFVLSEGGAVLCLEERESALARGATILAEVTGYANFSDAVDFTSPAEDCVAREQTIRWALRDAGLLPADLDYINAHGTSTTLNDMNETQSLKKALGDEAYRILRTSDRRRGELRDHCLPAGDGGGDHAGDGASDAARSAVRSRLYR